VELKGILKRFPGVIANRDVNVTVAPADVHAIVGENGAGKSTLMKILYGMQRPDAGTISVEGREVSFRTPTDAIEAGIGMVHQHFMLADNLTVLENIVLGAEPRKGIRLDFDAARQRIGEIGRAYGMELDPDALVEELDVGDRQRIEILKVLYRGARILILDEPTAVLVPSEVDRLFENLAELQREGITIIFISHKLDEVLKVANAITVMRAGTTVATADPKTTTAQQLAHLMVGSDLPTPETRESTVTDRVVFEVEGLTVSSPGRRNLVDDVSFRIHAGEILGVAGVEGNGQRELAAAVLGIEPISSGTVVLEGEDITSWSTRRRREAGVGYIPQDRHRYGLLLDATIWENAALGHQTTPPFGKGSWIDRRGSRQRAELIVSDYDVKTPGIDVQMLALSGGNQQKFIVGRELEAKPRVLVASNPTRGVDVGAQAAVWDQLRGARAAGLATLLLSADLEELIGLSDSLVVIYRGRLVASLRPDEVTPEVLGSYMTGAATQEAS
jgi:simple sugar transport system ATP-binding protein